MNVYEIVTNEVIRLVKERGVLPWQKPWHGGERPKNLVSKREYSGINFWILSLSDYSSPWWLTLKQANDLGGSVKRGEKSTIVVFWKRLDQDRAPAAPETQDVNAPSRHNEDARYVLRYYRVFNLAQCDGIDPSRIPAALIANNHNDPIEACETIVQGYLDRSGVTVEHGHGGASYSPEHDRVRMPDRDAFTGSEEYYGTLFHEVVHSTGHKTRLDRIKQGNHFGSDPYSKEELVAEMGSSLLCYTTNIQLKTVENSVSYLQHWLKRLQDDSRLLVLAASQAHRAVELIKGSQDEM